MRVRGWCSEITVAADIRNALVTAGVAGADILTVEPVLTLNDVTHRATLVRALVGIGSYHAFNAVGRATSDDLSIQFRDALGVGRFVLEWSYRPVDVTANLLARGSASLASLVRDWAAGLCDGLRTHMLLPSLPPLPPLTLYPWGQDNGAGPVLPPRAPPYALYTHRESAHPLVVSDGSLSVSYFSGQGQRVDGIFRLVLLPRWVVCMWASIAVTFALLLVLDFCTRGHDGETADAAATGAAGASAGVSGTSNLGAAPTHVGITIGVLDQQRARERPQPCAHEAEAQSQHTLFQNSAFPHYVEYGAEYWDKQSAAQEQGKPNHPMHSHRVHLHSANPVTLV